MDVEYYGKSSTTKKDFPAFATCFLPEKMSWAYTQTILNLLSAGLLQTLSTTWREDLE